MIFIAELFLELLMLIYALVVRPLLIGVLTVLVFIGDLLSKLYMTEEQFKTMMIRAGALVWLITGIQIIYYLIRNYMLNSM